MPKLPPQLATLLLLARFPCRTQGVEARCPSPSNRHERAECTVPTLCFVGVFFSMLFCQPQKSLCKTRVCRGGRRSQSKREEHVIVYPQIFDFCCLYASSWYWHGQYQTVFRRPS